MLCVEYTYIYCVSYISASRALKPKNDLLLLRTFKCFRNFKLGQPGNSLNVIHIF